MNTPSQTTETEKQRNARLFPWFAEIVAKFPRECITAAWIEETDENDNRTGVVLAGRIPADEYKHVWMDADKYYEMRDAFAYYAMSPAERKKHDSRNRPVAKRHSTKYRVATSKSRHR